MITVLCGGIGGACFLRALSSVAAPERITAVVNTGGDDWFHGLYVSPDADIIAYTLADEADEERGRGLRGDTYRWRDSLRRFGHETWFSIGDRDLATHIHRTRLLREGRTPSEIVAEIARAFGVDVRLLPMSDDRVRTVVETEAGDLSFQEFLVQRRAADPGRAVRFDGAAESRPAPAVLDAIRDAEAIFIAPDDPIGGIGPILAIPGVRDALRSAGARRVAISPIIGGRSPRAPAAELMAGLGFAVDVTGVARAYAGLIDALIVDPVDAALAPAVEAAGVEAISAPSEMRDDASRKALAVAALDAAGVAN